VFYRTFFIVIRKERVSSENILDSLFGWISKKVIVMNKNDVDRYMVVNYNYRLINVDIKEFKI
jgi:hypothetical protein